MAGSCGLNGETGHLLKTCLMGNPFNDLLDKIVNIAFLRQHFLLPGKIQESDTFSGSGWFH